MADDSKLSIAEARSFLSGADILPMTLGDDPEEADGLLAADAAPVPSQPEEADDGQSYEDSSVGLGIDIVEVERMASLLGRRPRFAEQVFSEEERRYCDSTSKPATHYALRFAAKEAVVKALGTGFADGIWVRDVEVRRGKGGRPFAVLSGRAQEVALQQGVREISISLSYTHTDAVACAMAVTEAAVQATEKRKDPMEELSLRFKETRKMLDEL